MVCSFWLAALLLIARGPSVGLGIRVLLLGDSVDRWMVRDWCYHQRSRSVIGKNYEWSAGSIRYMNVRGEMPAQVCTTDNTSISLDSSIAFAHLYGSNASGPYFHGFKNSAEDPYIDTPGRMQKILELYKANVGPPDRIMFSTNQWDVQGWYDNEHILQENETKWFEAVDLFTTSLRDRLDEIIRAVGPDVDVGLRTAVWEAKGGALLRRFNDIQRRLAADRGLTLFDLDADVWSSVGHDPSAANEAFLFRDWIHPKPYYLIAAAHKILGEQYTTAITSRHPRISHGPDYYLDAFRANASKLVYLVRANLTREGGGGRLFFFSRAEGRLYRDPCAYFLRVLRLGPSDVMDIAGLDPPALAGLPVHSIPPIFFDFAIYNATAGLVFVQGGIQRPLPPRSVDGVRAVFRSHAPVIPAAEGSEAARWLGLFEPGAAMPDIFAEGAVMKVQGHREIFCFCNGSRRSFPSMGVFASMGKDLSQVVTLPLALIKDFDAIPLGPSL